MGWLGDRNHARAVGGMVFPMAGELHVATTSVPPSDARYSNYLLTGVVCAPGVEPVAVQSSGIARANRWPTAGSVLPVTLDRADPRRFVIEWDRIPSAMGQAEALAEQLRTHLDPAVSGTATGPDAAPASSTWLPAGRAEPLTVPASTCTRPASAVVTAVQDVPVPAGLGPAGGVVDLTVNIDGAIVLIRASFPTREQRTRLAAIGATVPVLVDPNQPEVAEIVLNG